MNPLPQRETSQTQSLGDVLALGGLCVYTLTFVTTRLPLADIGIAVGTLGILLQGNRFRFPAPLWLYVAFVAWSFAGSFTSSFPETVRTLVVDQLKLLCVMFLFVNGLRRQGQIRFFLLFYLACFMAYPGRTSIINYMSGYNVYGRAVGSGTYANPNELAAHALVAFGVALGLAISGPFQRAARTLCLASAGVLLIVILLTQSRGAVIGLVAGMAPAFLAIGLKSPVRLVAAIAVLAFAIGMFVPDTAWQRLAGIGKLTSTETIAEADVEGSAAARYKVYQTAMRIALDHPVFGVGAGTYPEANVRYAPDLGKTDTHNTYLNLAAELGFPGLLVWGGMVTSVLYPAWRARRATRTAPLAVLQSWVERALWAYLIAALFGSFSRINVLFVMIAVLWRMTDILRTAAPSESRPAVGNDAFAR